MHTFSTWYINIFCKLDVLLVISILCILHTYFLIVGYLLFRNFYFEWCHRPVSLNIFIFLSLSLSLSLSLPPCSAVRVGGGGDGGDGGVGGVLEMKTKSLSFPGMLAACSLLLLLLTGEGQVQVREVA